MKKQQSKTKVKEARKTENLAKVKKASTSRKKLDVEENLPKGFSRHRSDRSRVMLSAMRKGMEQSKEAGKKPSAAGAKPILEKREKREKEIQISTEPADQAVPDSLKVHGTQEKENEDKKQEEAAVDGKPAVLETKKDFRTRRKDYEEVDPNLIEEIVIVPDYLLASACLDPEIIKTPSSYCCLEGWEQILEARAAKRRIRCHVSYVGEVSELEKGLRKGSIRSAPEGGRALHAEMVRIVHILFPLLAVDQENILVYSHGGPRRGAEYTNDRNEKNIREVLAERLGRSPDAITRYFRHGQYLDRATIDFLVSEKKEKEFFDTVQRVKRKIVDNMKSEGATEEEITRRVSEAVLAMARDPKQIDENWADLTQASTEESADAFRKSTRSIENGDNGWDGQDEKKEFEEERNEDGAAEKKAQPRFSPMEDSVIQEDLTLQVHDIRWRGKELGRKFAEIFANEESTLPGEKEALNSLIQEMISLVAEIPEAETTEPI